jgi:threonine dehydratase
VTGIIAKVRANIVNVEHERAHFGVRIGNTMMDFTIETRSPEHARELFVALREAGYEVEVIR